jgi:hypothetical protein
MSDKIDTAATLISARTSILRRKEFFARCEATGKPLGLRQKAGVIHSSGGVSGDVAFLPNSAPPAV